MLRCNGVKLERSNVDTKSSEDFIFVKGYACHFGKANLNGEIVTKDSFDAFFNVLKESSVMPSINFQHDPTEIIGGWDKLEPKDDGLWVEGRICKKVKRVQDTILPLMEAGMLNWLSTEGFVDLDSLEFNDDGTYTVKDFMLCRISLVDVPADLNATVEHNAVTLERKNRKEEEPMPKETKRHKVIIY